jgi:hypothetical protein
MIYPYTEVRYINAEKGYGLFALRSIPRGTITWVRDPLDREITPGELAGFVKPLQEIILHYSYRNSAGNFIFCWDNTRFVNHSCTPNCCLTAYNLEVAVRDIQPEEEITNHYGTLNIIEPFSITAPNRVTIRPDDLLHHGPEWDLVLKEVFPLVVQVNQPLRPFISEEQWNILDETSRGMRQLVSIASCYFAGCSQWQNTRW